jgi:hypothetical protein
LLGVAGTGAPGAGQGAEWLEDCLASRTRNLHDDDPAAGAGGDADIGPCPLGPPGIDLPAIGGRRAERDPRMPPETRAVSWWQVQRPA